MTCTVDRGPLGAPGTPGLGRAGAGCARPVPEQGAEPAVRAPEHGAVSSGRHWRGHSRPPHGGLPAPPAAPRITEQWAGPPPRQLQDGGLRGRSEGPPASCGVGSTWPLTAAVCLHTREAHNMARPSDARRAEAGLARQSTFSTLPMIFSSNTGSTVSSSRTSSNTTPQSNSSLTFLK